MSIFVFFLIYVIFNLTHPNENGPKNFSQHFGPKISKKSISDKNLKGFGRWPHDLTWNAPYIYMYISSIHWNVPWRKRGYIFFTNIIIVIIINKTIFIISYSFYNINLQLSIHPLISHTLTCSEYLHLYVFGESKTALGSYANHYYQVIRLV